MRESGEKKELWFQRWHTSGRPSQFSGRPLKGWVELDSFKEAGWDEQRRNCGDVGLFRPFYFGVRKELTSHLWYPWIESHFPTKQGWQNFGQPGRELWNENHPSELPPSGQTGQGPVPSPPSVSAWGCLGKGMTSCKHSLELNINSFLEVCLGSTSPHLPQLFAHCTLLAF